MHICKQSSANNTLHFKITPKIAAYLSSFLFFRVKKYRENKAISLLCFTNKCASLKMSLKEMSLPNPDGFFMMDSERYSHEKRYVGKVKLLTLNRKEFCAASALGSPSPMCLVP